MFDRFSFRPYYTNDGRLQAKLSVLWDKEYILVRGPHGEHFEEFANLDDAQNLSRIILRAKSGILGGYEPYPAKPMRQHSNKSYDRTVLVAGRGRKFLVRRGGGDFDRVINIGKDGKGVGYSYLVPHEDVSDDRPYIPDEFLT
jgi:hypothetical protein